MARVGDIKFIPSAGSGNPAMLSLDMIPEEIKKEVEEAYALLKTATGRLRVQFDTKQEADDYWMQVDSYCRQRPDELGGPIRARKSPSKGLPQTVFDYRITDLQTEAEKATEAIQTATAAVNTERETAAEVLRETAAEATATRKSRR